MGGTALFDSDFRKTQLAGKALRPDQRRIPFAEGNYGLRSKFRKHDLLLGPDPAFPPQPAVEEVFPVRRGALLKSRHIVAHFKQAAAFWTSIKDFLKGIADTAPGEAFEPCAQRHREEYSKPLAAWRAAEALAAGARETPG